MFSLLSGFSIATQLRHAQSRASRAMESAVPWPQAKKPRGCYDIGIKAETYCIENPLDLVFPGAPSERVSQLLSPDGLWCYSKRVLPKGVGIEVTDSPDLYHSGGKAYFTDDVDIPLLSDRKDPSLPWVTWMSLTPNEIWSQVSGVRAASKNVVIGGLGMGWLLQEVARKRSVKAIRVVECSRPLIEWYGQELVSALSAKFNKPITLINGSIWEQEFDPDDRILLDIWRGFGDAARDKNLDELRAHQRFVWAWGSPRGGGR